MSHRPKPEDVSADRGEEQDDSRAVAPSRRQLLSAGLGFLLALIGGGGSGSLSASSSFDISDRYSPRDKRRPQRPDTDYIVLHTTEGGELGSLRKIQRRGEANYFVTPRGAVYRIIHKSRIATHAGRSMWDGKRTIDNYSIGIEVVGYHNREPTDAQYASLKELLRQLKSFYRISDKNVLTHSMVAYGRPNRFHPENHRGRKRCGMIFARDDVRWRLGLIDKPQRDNDVRAGRLAVGDPELQRYLYARSKTPPQRPTHTSEPAESNVIGSGRTAWYIARERYNSPGTTYVFPNGTRLAGDRIENWDRIPVGTQVLVGAQDDSEAGFEGFLEIGKDGKTAWDLAGKAYDDATTIYFFPNGIVRTGSELRGRRSTRKLLDNLPDKTRVLVGYVYGGHVRSSRLPARIAGRKWNYPSTYYRFPDGTIVSGDEVDASSIPQRTLVFYQG